MEQNWFLNCVKKIDLKKLSEKINIKDYSTIFMDFDGTIKQSDEVKGKLFYEIFGGINLKLKKYTIIILIT